MKTLKYILKSGIISKEDKEKLEKHDGNDGLLYDDLSDSVIFFQLYNNKKGWAFYDQNGKLVQRAPVKSLIPMQPININGQLGGVTYAAEYDGYDIRWTNKYILFDGTILKGLDSVLRIYYYNKQRIYLVSNAIGYTDVYNLNGDLLYRYKEEVQQPLGYSLVGEKGSYCLRSDDNYKLLKCGISDFITGSQNSSFVKDGSKYYYMSLIENKVSTKPYIKVIVTPKSSFYICFTNEKEFDVLDDTGQIIFSNCTYYHIGGLYLVLRDNEYEYWMTKGLKVYAKHRVL